MKLSVKIKAAREKAGLTQDQAAAKSGYSKSAIQKFESGRRTPPLRSIKHILEALEETTP